LTADLTGVIPPPARGQLRLSPPILRLWTGGFLRFHAMEQGGTFVPGLDYFRSRCAMPSGALNRKQKV
jgi:hypothetical protein